MYGKERDSKQTPLIKVTTQVHTFPMTLHSTMVLQNDGKHVIPSEGGFLLS